MNAESLPREVDLAMQRAMRAGFAMSCDPDTGRLLAVLAAAIPAGGRVQELGTGTGVGTAWIIHGLHERTDVEALTIEIDPAIAAFATQAAWPELMTLLVGDAVNVIPQAGSFDLIFADAQGGKWEALDPTIAALRPGAHLLVDDMTSDQFLSDTHVRKTHEVRERLLAHPDLRSVEISWSTGLILSTKLHRKLGHPQVLTIAPLVEN